MRLQSLDELFEFLSYKDLKISDLEFAISPSKEKVQESRGSLVEELPQSPKTSQCSTTANSNAYTGKIRTFNNDPNIALEEGTEDTIFVKDFESIPNSCHMGKITMLGRELYGGICTEGDDSKIDLLIEYDKEGEQIAVHRSFKLKKIDENQQEKVILNISE